MTKMTLITGAERRRRWSAEDRERILAAACAPGSVVADVARRADISTSLIYRWRRQLLDDGGGAGFAPLPFGPRGWAARISSSSCGEA